MAFADRRLDETRRVGITDDVRGGNILPHLVIEIPVRPVRPGRPVRLGRPVPGSASSASSAGSAPLAVRRFRFHGSGSVRWISCRMLVEGAYGIRNIDNPEKSELSVTRPFPSVPMGEAEGTPECRMLAVYSNLSGILDSS